MAIHVVTEQHWQNLLQAMGREELADDPRFRTNKDRTANMEATEAVVTEWTTRLGKMEVAAAAKRYRIPCAPVRNPVEVMQDAHMHERGMLQRIAHPDLGEIVVPNTPLRLHGADRVQPVPSPRLGQHNAEVYGELLGLDAEEIARLQSEGVI